MESYFEPAEHVSHAHAKSFMLISEEIFFQMGDPEPDLPKLFIMEKTNDGKIVEQIHFIRFFAEDISRPETSIFETGHEKGFSESSGADSLGYTFTKTDPGDYENNHDFPSY